MRLFGRQLETWTAKEIASSGGRRRPSWSALSRSLSARRSKTPSRRRRVAIG